MKKIGVLTATRAEYGLLRRLIEKLSMFQEYEVRVLVTGMHLASEFGNTYREIENDGVKIAKKIPILLSGDDANSISKAMGLAMIGFGDYFSDNNLDTLIVLGDRFETLAVCLAAMNAKIPIIHLYGGDTTEGAIDEAIRHSITKLSYLHFTSTQIARKRVIQLGESPDRVFAVGSTGVENIATMKLLSKEELEKKLNFGLNKKYAVITYHPVTLDNEKMEDKIKELLTALDKFDSMSYIITKANADAEGKQINELLQDYSSKHSNVCFFDSLGMVKYLSALKYSEMVIGNSSSGLSETPSFGIPTINIGDRQKGRVQGKSVINCGVSSDDIENAIKLAMDKEFRKTCAFCENPYGDGKTTDKMIAIIQSFLAQESIDLKKKFYNIKI